MNGVMKRLNGMGEFGRALVTNIEEWLRDVNRFLFAKDTAFVTDSAENTKFGMLCERR